MQLQFDSLAKSLVLSCALSLALALPAHAHDPGLSNVELRIAGGQLVAFLAFNRADIEPLLTIDANRDGNCTTEEFNLARPRLEALALEMLEITADGRKLAPQIAKVELGESNDVQFYVNFNGEAAPPIEAKSLLLARLARSHRQIVSLRNEQNEILNEQILDAAHATFDSRATGSRADEARSFSFGEFLQLGIEHIFTGYDHLAFLFALLIVGSGLKEAVKIVTSFTIAHSITLAVATLGWINLPSTIVEPLIAASILYVGVENLLRHDLQYRWLLTFFFGLIHGFGFASVLRELGIGANGRGVAMPLVSFNLGVEVGQLAIAALVLPIIWKLRESPAFVQRAVPVFSILVSLAGLWWLLERTVLNR